MALSAEVSPSFSPYTEGRPFLEPLPRRPLLHFAVDEASAAESRQVTSRRTGRQTEVKEIVRLESSAPSILLLRPSCLQLLRFPEANSTPGTGGDDISHEHLLRCGFFTSFLWLLCFLIDTLTNRYFLFYSLLQFPAVCVCVCVCASLVFQRTFCRFFLHASALAFRAQC